MWSSLFKNMPYYSPVEITVTSMVQTDEESVHTMEKTAEEMVRALPPKNEWLEDKCFVCNTNVEFLQGVYQTTGCTKHFGAAVTGTLGLNKNTLNLVHTGACYEAYVGILRTGGSNCTLCRGDGIHKPPAEFHQVTPLAVVRHVDHEQSSGLEVPHSAAAPPRLHHAAQPHPHPHLHQQQQQQHHNPSHQHPHHHTHPHAASAPPVLMAPPAYNYYSDYGVPHASSMEHSHYDDD